MIRSRKKFQRFMQECEDESIKIGWQYTDYRKKLLKFISNFDLKKTNLIDLPKLQKVYEELFPNSFFN